MHEQLAPYKAAKTYLSTSLEGPLTEQPHFKVRRNMVAILPGSAASADPTKVLQSAKLQKRPVLR